MTLQPFLYGVGLASSASTTLSGPISIQNSAFRIILGCQIFPFLLKKPLLQEILHASTWAEIIVLESSRKLYGT